MIDDIFVIFDDLKHNISLNIVSCLGHVGFVVFVYYIFFSLVLQGKLAYFPHMTLENACAYLTLTVLLFFLLTISALLEPFFCKILKMHNIEIDMMKYFDFLSARAFRLGLVFALMGVCFYLYFAIPAISFE